ncbi:hypothetical protein Leryth_007820 [Lithospermum erythrorhizon]|uniref:Uncharacterized protein n=1 Tax=Lithospermum erythrorhizon TaxID=34254 RepID=A0AAV3RP62_LITER|nr:hypothetical protein Leryth_007820 [Lithospermum erythrorhizon]
MDQPTPPPPAAAPPPLTTKLPRAKLAWRVLLISNLALGAYLFTKPLKKESVEETAKVEAEVSSTPTETSTPTFEEPLLSPPITPPIIVRDPIPEDQQRELFKWVLEEKRKVKPQSREEKKKIDEEKAILKQFIRAESIPKI